MGGATAEDRIEIAKLARRYGPAVSTYFARRIASRADVEDLTQDVFASLLRRAELADIDNVEGYIFQIAANRLRERIREQGRRIAVTGEPPDEDYLATSEDSSPERILLDKQAFGRLLRGLRELPERARTVVVLNRYEGLSAREIARRLGVSVSTIEKDLIRAIAHLRDQVR